MMKKKKLIPVKLVSVHYKNGVILALALLLLIPITTTIPVNAQELTLKQCIDTALQHNRSILLSSQDILLAGEKRKEVAGNLIPKINASADYRYYTDLPYQLMPASVFGGPAGTYKEVQFGVPQTFGANLQFSMPIISPTALSALETTAIANDLAEIQHVKTEEEVILDVSQAYYNGQILLSQITFLDTNIINMSRLQQTTALLYEQQLAKRSDMDRTQLQLDQLKSKRTTLYAQYRQVINVLGFLMGKPLSGSLEVKPVATSFTETIYEQRDITELKLVEKKLEFNQSELSGLKRSRLPSIGAYAMYGTSGMGNTGDNSFFNFYPIGFVGVQLSVPLFNGTTTQHRINQKKIEISKTSLQQSMAIEKNNMEAENARRQYVAANEYASTTMSQIVLARKIYATTVLQNQHGVASLTDVLLADNSLREAQQNYSAALIGLFKAELEMQKVTGNLLNK